MFPNGGIASLSCKSGPADTGDPTRLRLAAEFAPAEAALADARRFVEIEKPDYSERPPPPAQEKPRGRVPLP
jgi:hypothetical protein